MPRGLEDRRERVVLVGLASSQAHVPAAESSLEELALLADTAGAEALERILQVRDAPDPATYIGRGKAKEVMGIARALKADAVIFDDELAPAQGRNLEDVAGINPLHPDLKIIDRTGLILDVFSQHAHSAEGKLQVELAQINYMLPRLRGWGEVLSRTGAGIGTRGPGETKLEVDRRRINRRLAKLRRDLEDLERTRGVKRSRRVRAGIPQISLVGYTNAGKSTLLNALTGAGVLVEDRLFSTLDPTARRLELPDGRAAVLIDTVGFVRKLPHQLVEAFRSTLEETKTSDLLLHVADASDSDPSGQVEAVERVLREIGANEARRLIALNKADLLTDGIRTVIAKTFPDAVFISATTGEGLPKLLELVAGSVDAARTVATLRIPHERGEVRNELHVEGQVLEESFEPEGAVMVVRAPSALVHRYAEYLIDEAPLAVDDDALD